MPSLVELFSCTRLGIRGGNPDLSGEANMGSLVGGKALGSPAGGLFSSEWEFVELLLLFSSLALLLAAFSDVFPFNYKNQLK